MSRFLHRSTQIAIDFAVLSLALWAAFFLRFEGVPPALHLKRLVFVWPYVVGFQYAVLAGFGVPRYAWRYVGLREVSRIFTALGLSAVALLAVRLVIGSVDLSFAPARYAAVPIGVVVIDLALAFLGVAGVRTLRRVMVERARSRDLRAAPGGSPRDATRTLLVGAGSAGWLVAREIAMRPDMGLEAVGFLDDNPAKIGSEVHGLAVLGTTAELAAIAERTRAEQALITIAQASGREIRRISDLCRDHGIATKIIPPISEIVDGSVNVSLIRELAVEDLLGREPVELDLDAISGALRGRPVAVTGAGGSIGAELCRQVARFDPSALILVEQAENALFAIHRELAERHSSLTLVPMIGDVCDRPRMEEVFASRRPEVVFHAAAHKHVPMMEWNPGEAVKNNVLGTRVLADLAHRHGVDVFVMISTDKAVNPTSVMGATKRVAERYTQALSTGGGTRFVTVRFGNVLGSAGSVIPIFKEQIAAGGPVTVTHPEMRRYFMTIPEACQLVLQAGSMGTGSEIFILDMGEPVRIVDLARDLITLSGLRPDHDIAIEVTGIRPGEKLFEELSVSEENASKTRHPKILVGKGAPCRVEELRAELDRLAEVADSGDPEATRAALRALVPEYCPGGEAAAAPEPEPERAPEPDAATSWPPAPLRPIAGKLA
jgi:FlaA1/EpsC-like NDP-sugar epimerase